MSEESVVEMEGYNVIPVSVEFQQITDNVKHYIYVKEHSTRFNDGKPKDRTLVVANVPDYFAEETLSQLFIQCGEIEKIILPKRTSYAVTEEEDKFNSFNFNSKLKDNKRNFAYVVFQKASSLKNVRSIKHLTVNCSSIHTGVRKWCSAYGAAKPQAEKLKEEVNKYMAEYDARVEEELKKEKAEEGVPDEDGWVTVTRNSSNRGASRTEAKQKALAAKEKEKRKEKELLNFYAFQIRDSKKAHIGELREKFEEDKQRIKDMRAQRKFKPF